MGYTNASHLRKYDPLPADHPGVGQTCMLCNKFIQAGDVTTLLPTGPADDEEAEKMRAGRTYIAIAALVHWDCLNLFDAIEV